MLLTFPKNGRNVWKILQSIYLIALILAAILFIISDVEYTVLSSISRTEYNFILWHYTYPLTLVYLLLGGGRMYYMLRHRLPANKFP